MKKNKNPQIPRWVCRREGNGASQPSRPNRRGADVKVCPHSTMLKLRLCWESRPLAAASGSRCTDGNPGSRCPSARRGQSRACLSRPASVARSGESTSYVGTPAVGTSRAAPLPEGSHRIGPEDSLRSINSAAGWCGARLPLLVAWFLAFFRLFFLPRTLFEPATSFKIGYPEEYGLGVDTKFQQKYRIWVDRTPGSCRRWLLTGCKWARRDGSQNFATSRCFASFFLAPLSGRAASIPPVLHLVGTARGVQI